MQAFRGRLAANFVEEQLPRSGRKFGDMPGGCHDLAWVASCQRGAGECHERWIGFVGGDFFQGLDYLLARAVMVQVRQADLMHLFKFQQRAGTRGAMPARSQDVAPRVPATPPKPDKSLK